MSSRSSEIFEDVQIIANPSLADEGSLMVLGTINKFMPTLRPQMREFDIDMDVLIAGQEKPFWTGKVYGTFLTTKMWNAHKLIGQDCTTMYQNSVIEVRKQLMAALEKSGKLK